LEFNLEQLELIAFWGRVALGELNLTDEDRKLLESINETLKHWGS
jgi:hypothetical protein